MTKVICKESNQTTKDFILPALPFANDTLEPYYSQKLISLHHGKHHAAYVNNLNKLIPGTKYENLSLEEIIKESAKNSADKSIFNNAAQIWNHTFFWNCMKQNGGGKPEGDLLKLIEKSFCSFESFKEQFSKAATTLFGSGWAWLVLDGDRLKITQESNAGTPLAEELIPILTLDVWEHAYYPDYENKRPDFITTFLDNLVNWDFVNQMYENHK